MNNAESPAKSKTLAQQLSEGRLPVQDGLRYAALLAEALRKIHDDGRAHGGVTPDVVAVDGAGLELMPASPTAPRVTPYTAPEVAAQNRAADARSDIFSFGTIVYEMLTGRRAFVGEPEAVLIASLCNSAAAPTGSPAVDRLVGGCLAKDPAARWQRMQKIILELKLLTAAARRTATAPVVRRDPAAEAALRAEMQQIESRLSARLQAHADATAQTQQAIANNLRSEFAGTGDQMAVRLQAHEQSAAQIHQSVLQAVNDLRGQFAGSHDQLAARLQSQEQSNAQVHQSVGEALNGLRGEFTGAGDQLAARLQSHEQTSAQAQQAMHESVATLKAQLEAVSGQLAAAQEKMNQPVAIPELAHLNEQIAGVHNRIGKMEEAVNAGTGSAAVEASLEALKKQMTELHTNIAADMHEFELNMKAQANAIESARTAMAQTDDLVERVVEALESLQSTVLDHADERAMALN